MNRLIRLISDVIRLAGCWLAVDRIRIASTEGRLLRIREGDRLLIRGRLYRVEQRQTFMSAEDHRISYCLSDDDSALASLDVTFPVPPSSDGQILFVQDNIRRELFEEDVVILPDYYRHSGVKADGTTQKSAARIQPPPRPGSP